MRLCFFCCYAASSCVACSCRFSLLLSLLLVSLPYCRLLWFAPSRGLKCMLYFVSCLPCYPSLLCGPPACVVGASTRSGLAISLGVLLFRRLSLLLLVVIAGPPPLLWLFCGGPVWLQLLSQLWSSLLVGFLRWSGCPLCVLPVCLAGCSWLSDRRRFSSCLLLSGARGFGSFSFSSAPRSLSLSLCSFLVQPSSLWGLFLIGCGVCLWCLRPSSCASLSFFVSRLFVSLWFLGGWRPVVALSRLRGGVQLCCFPWCPPSLFFRLCPGRWVVFLALSFACRLVPVRRVFTVPYGFGMELPLPSMRALRSASLRPLGCSSVSCLLSRRCCLSSTLVFSVPLPVGSSWAPLSRFSWRRGLPPLPG